MDVIEIMFFSLHKVGFQLRWVSKIGGWYVKAGIVRDGR